MLAGPQSVQPVARHSQTTSEDKKADIFPSSKAESYHVTELGKALQRWEARPTEPCTARPEPPQTEDSPTPTPLPQHAVPTTMPSVTRLAYIL